MIQDYKTKIGIVGAGVVGGAIISATTPDFSLDVRVVDIDPAKNTHTYEDLMECDGVFICTPTPQSEDGTCDVNILLNVLGKLQKYKGVIISKSTAPIDVYQKLNEIYPNLVHAPEFLTEANAIRDFMAGEFAFIGGNTKAYMKEAERIILKTQPYLQNIYHCTIGEAAMAKYAINTFLATKVSFMNEIYKLAQKMNCDYEIVSEMVMSDNRIGRSHMKVPGPDGKFGFGGMCFPKDTSALLKFAESNGVHLGVLDSAIRVNKSLRDDV